jgi:transcriptional regulator with XRE-family HTH domain
MRTHKMITPDDFKARRRRLNMTQARLANYFDLSERQISRYENGILKIPRTVSMLMVILTSRTIPKHHLNR